VFTIPLQAILLAVVIHALWGGIAIAVKFGLLAFPPYWSAFIRFVFGIVTIAVWCRYRGLRLMPTSEEWWPLFFISLLFTVQIGLMNLGFDQTSGINGSILISTNPLFAAIFAHILIKSDSLTMLRSLGLILGFGGVVIAILSTATAGELIDFGTVGDWLCLLSAALLGFRLIASARIMARLDPFRLAMWQMILSLPLFAFAAVSFETINWEAFGLVPVLGLVYQGVVVAGIGFMVSFWLISRYPPSIMVSFGFISPVTGVLLSALLLNESLSWSVLLSVVLLAAGLVLVCTGNVSKAPLSKSQRT